MKHLHCTGQPGSMYSWHRLVLIDDWLIVWLTCRLWYRRGLSGGEKAVRQLHYLHVIPARLETHPRAFNPKFQTLDATLDTLNEQLSCAETVINGRSNMLALWYCICWVLCTFISCEQCPLLILQFFYFLICLFQHWS